MKPQDKMLRDFTLPNLPVSELQKKTAATQKQPQIIGGNTGTPDYLMKKPMAPEHLMEDLYAPAPEMPMMQPQDKMLRDFTLPNLPVSELQKKTAATQKLPEGSTDKRGWGFTLENLPEEEPRSLGETLARQTTS